MKYNLDSDKHHIVYPPLENSWAFVKKRGCTYKLLGPALKCKDYMHEIICNILHNRNICGLNGYTIKSPIHLDKLQFVMFFKKPSRKEKKRSSSFNTLSGGSETGTEESEKDSFSDNAESETDNLKITLESCDYFGDSEESNFFCGSSKNKEIKNTENKCFCIRC